MSTLDFLPKVLAIERLVRFIQHVDLIPKWNEWYVGVTDNPRRRLYDEHNASLEQSSVVSVVSANMARSVVRFLINLYGMGGNPGSGDNTRFVYVFRKTADTDPPL